MERSLVPILGYWDALVQLANNPIMSGRSIRLFRQLKHQNLSTGDDFINSSRIILVPFIATREPVAPLTSDPVI